MNRKRKKKSNKSTFKIAPIKSEYSFLTEMQSLVNNKKFSDVSFSVGEEKKLIFAHKMILATGSPVMEKMFYGNLAEKEYPIKIPDLTSKAFIDMMRYIYGYDVDFHLSNLYEVYKAADKYLVYNLTDKILEYIKRNSNRLNCCLIYDQLVRINQDNDTLEHVRNLIKISTKDAFESEFFVKISKECLINILKMDILNISEIVILERCLYWIEAELIRNKLSLTIENKRSLFEEIKPFIRFSQITINELSGFKKIDSLLSDKDIGNLFLYLTDNKRQIPIECKVLRKSFNVSTACTKIEVLRLFQSPKTVKLCTNKEIIITKIKTLLNSSINNVELEISYNLNNENQIIVNKYNKILVNNYWNFEFDYLKINPNTHYQIKLKFNPITNSSFYRTEILKERLFIDNNNQIFITLEFNNNHFIKGITFCH